MAARARLHRKPAAEPFDPYAEWTGMPAFEQRDLQSVFRVVVHFASDAHAEAFFELIDRPKRRSMWWPQTDGHTGGGSKYAYVAVDQGQAQAA